VLEADSQQAPIHERYADRYRRDQSVARAVASDVCGHELAESGYTTRAQADRLVSALKLSESPLVLDVGSGRGWPAVHLADLRPDWRVIASDVPTEGLVHVRRRVAGVVAGSAVRLPFRDQVFHAVLHADVFC
jgi:ubiquinone/menaquinone biosynthesis C-methylase UbiE